MDVVDETFEGTTNPEQGNDWYLIFRHLPVWNQRLLNVRATREKIYLYFCINGNVILVL